MDRKPLSARHATSLIGALELQVSSESPAVPTLPALRSVFEALDAESSKEELDVEDALTAFEGLARARKAALDEETQSSIGAVARLLMLKVRGGVALPWHSWDCLHRPHISDK